jgi:hypothetical protein
MDNERKYLINKCNDRINQLKLFMKNDENMILGIKNLGETDYVKAQLTKYNIKKDERNKEIEELGEKIVRIDSGSMDQEIASEKEKSLKEREERQRCIDDKLKQESKNKLEEEQIIKHNKYLSNLEKSEKQLEEMRILESIKYQEQKQKEL